MMTVIRTLVAFSLIVPAVTACTQSSEKQTQEEANRKQVVDFYNQFFNEHKTAEAARIVVDDYKQHNPNVPDGKEPFVSYFTDFI